MWLHGEIRPTGSCKEHGCALYCADYAVLSKILTATTQLPQSFAIRPHNTCSLAAQRMCGESLAASKFDNRSSRLQPACALHTVALSPTRSKRSCVSINTHQFGYGAQEAFRPGDMHVLACNRLLQSSCSMLVHHIRSVFNIVNHPHTIALPELDTQFKLKDLAHVVSTDVVCTQCQVA